MSPSFPPSMRAHVRRLATSARAYTVRRISPAGSVDRFTASPRDLVDKFGLLPRDCRLLATSNAHIAVRENYFLFRFPPFTGAVRHDAALLIADHDNVIAVETLQQRLVNTTLGGAGAANGGATHTLSFEHKVLDAMLQEDTLHKRDRYARLATLIETATSPTVTSSTGSIIGFYKVREASLYRLLTLSRSLSALGLDVKRSSAALAQLLSSDEDMEGTYLTYRQASGAGQPIDQVSGDRRLSHGPRPGRPERATPCWLWLTLTLAVLRTSLSAAHGRGADARIFRDGAR